MSDSIPEHETLIPAARLLQLADEHESTAAKIGVRVEERAREHEAQVRALVEAFQHDMAKLHNARERALGAAAALRSAAGEG